MSSITNALVSSAMTFYVSVSGNDANSCAAAQNITTPRSSFVGGTSCLNPGDTLYIRGGTYVTSDQQNVGRFCTAAQPCLVAGYPGDSRPVLLTTPGSGVGTVLNIDTGESGQCGVGCGDAYMTFRGFDVDGINQSEGGQTIIVGLSHVTLEDLTVSNAPRNAIHVVEFPPNGADYTTIRNTRMLGCGRIQSLADPFDTKGSGVYTVGAFGLYENNIIDGCSNGFEINYGYNHHSIYRNNIIRNLGIYATYGGEGPGEATWARGFGIGLIFPGESLQPDSNQIYNNIIYNVRGESDAGINGEGYCWNFTGSTNTLLANNTCYNADAPYFVLGGTENTDLTYQNNILFGLGRITPVEQPGQLSGNISNNLYNPNIAATVVDAAGGDFHLVEGGPAHEQGATIVVIATDIAGTPRPQGSAYDIGAYEFTEALPDPPTVTITTNGGANFGTSTTPLTTLEGTASDIDGTFTVTVTCSPSCGTPTVTNPTSSPWSVASLPLTAGDNVITARATDNDALVTEDTITVTFQETSALGAPLQMRFVP